MQQQDLITATPAARRSDPESSHLAAEAITGNGARARQQQQVWGGVLMFPGLTSRELAEKMGADRYMVARRLPELETANRIHKGGSRLCGIGKRLAVTWWPGRKEES